MVTPIPSAALGIKDPNPRILTLKTPSSREVQRLERSQEPGRISGFGGKLRAGRTVLLRLSGRKCCQVRSAV